MRASIGRTWSATARCAWDSISCAGWARSSESVWKRRSRQGPFDDVLAFAQRTQLERETLENLAIAGAFAPWYASRREAMWALRGLDEREARGELGALMDLDEPAVELEAPSRKETRRLRSLVDGRHAVGTSDGALSQAPCRAERVPAARLAS